MFYYAIYLDLIFLTTICLFNHCQLFMGICVIYFFHVLIMLYTMNWMVFYHEHVYRLWHLSIDRFLYIEYGIYPLIHFI